MGMAAVCAVGVRSASASASAATNARRCASRSASQEVIARGHAAAHLDAGTDVRIDGQAHIVHEMADEPVPLRADDSTDAGGIVAEAIGERDAHDLGAEACERLHRRIVRREHVGIDAEALVVREHGQAQAAHAAA